MAELRREVLSCFRRLHKTRRVVFDGDQYALQEARKRINDEFRKNMSETEPTKIKEHLKLGNEVEEFLRTHVIQASLTPNGNYELRTNKDTKLLDNMPYKTC